ncbi:MAG: RodZ domain-containing protein [Thiotrichales bacterium]
MTQQDSGLQTDVAACGIGATLRAARTAAGRSAEEIASELHMHVKQINALERDDFKFFPSAAFVKGYIRSYSKIVGIDAQPLLNEFARIDLNEPAWSTHAPVEDQRPNKWLLGVGSIVVVALVVGLFVAWLVNSGYLNRLVQGAAETEYPGVAEAVVPPAVESRAVPAPRDEVAEPPAAEVSAPESTASPAPGYAAVEARVEQIALPPPGLGLQPPPPEALEPSSRDAGAAEGSTRGESIAATAPPAATATADATPSATLNVLQTVGEGDDVVKFTLVDDCWVELYDASRNKLLYGLYKTGDVKTVKGNAPFQVFLGFAPGARLEFNGKPFDIAQYTKSSLTARFALVNE